MKDLQRINIGFIVPSYKTMGGLEKYSLSLADKLSPFFNKVYIFTADIPDKDYTPNNINIIKFDFKPTQPNTLSFNNLLEQHGIKLLIYHGLYPHINNFAYQWKKHGSIPLISVIHNKPTINITPKNKINTDSLKNVIKKFAYPIYSRLLKRIIWNSVNKAIKSSEAIVLLSPKYIDIFQNIYGKKRTKLIAIPNFIENTIDSYRRTNECKKILYLGRIEETQKKFSRVISIWRKICLKYPDWKLEVVGIGSELQKWQSYCRDNNIPRISFSGFQNQVDLFYQNSDIFIMTSDYEGFPLTICEAIVNQCTPILYNSFDAAEDIIPSELESVLVTPFNEDEFINKLSQLIENTTLRETINSTLYHNIQRYTPSAIIPIWINLIKSNLK